MAIKTRKAEDTLPAWIMAVGAAAGIGIVALLSLEARHNPPSLGMEGGVKTERAASIGKPSNTVSTAIGAAQGDSSVPSREKAAGQQIADLLASTDLGNAQIADKLLTLLPRLPADLQREAAMHIANLSIDGEGNTPPAWADALVRDRLPAEAREVLFTQLCAQPPQCALPLLAAIADNPDHPLHQNAADFLEPILGPQGEEVSWSKGLSEYQHASLQASK